MGFGFSTPSILFSTAEDFLRVSYYFFHAECFHLVVMRISFSIFLIAACLVVFLVARPRHPSPVTVRSLEPAQDVDVSMPPSDLDSLNTLNVNPQDPPTSFSLSDQLTGPDLSDLVTKNNSSDIPDSLNFPLRDAMCKRVSGVKKFPILDCGNAYGVWCSEKPFSVFFPDWYGFDMLGCVSCITPPKDIISGQDGVSKGLGEGFRLEMSGRRYE